MYAVEDGDLVTIHFTLTFKNGVIYTSTRNKAPFQFKVGEKQVFPGIESAVLGMEEGQQKKVTLSAKDTVGPRHNELILEFPRSSVPDHIQCELGKKIEITQENNPPFRGVVSHVDDEKIIIDGNLPISGKEMILTIELIEIN